MGFLNPPKPPSAASVTAAQQQANQANVGLMQQTAGNTSGPYQSTTNIFDPNDPNRLLTTTSLSGANQQALDQLQGNRFGIGAGLGGLLGNVDLAQAFDPNTANALTGDMMTNFDNFMNPYRDRETAGLENRLNTQGASDNARNFARMQLSDNQARQRGAFFNQARGQAFNEATEQYNNPRRTIQQLLSLIGPYFGNQQGPSSYTSNAADAQGNMQKEYAAKLANYQSTMSGIGAIGSAIMGFPLGTAAGAVPTVGSTIGGGIAGMFT